MAKIAECKVGSKAHATRGYVRLECEIIEVKESGLIKVVYPRTVGKKRVANVLARQIDFD